LPDVTKNFVGIGSMVVGEERASYVGT